MQIEIKGWMTVEPEGVYQSEVVKSGNGAVIKFFKRFLGKKVIVIIASKVTKKKKRMTKQEADDKFSEATEDAALYG